jgi:hypothetical protein
LVQGNVYGIKIISAEKTDSYSEVAIPIRTVRAPPDLVFLEIKFVLFKRGEPIWEQQELQELTVVDSKGETYPPKYAKLEGTVDRVGGVVFTPDNGVVYFSVPKNMTGFKLRYRDVPLTDLGV